jgi:hypothetical protein
VELKQALNSIHITAQSTKYFCSCSKLLFTAQESLPLWRGNIFKFLCYINALAFCALFPQREGSYRVVHQDMRAA